MMRRLRHALSGAIGPTWVGLVYAFMLAPMVVVVAASLNGPDANFIDFPPRDLSLVWYTRIDPAHFRALGVSTALATAAALIAVLLGVPAAFAIVRGRFSGKALVATLIRSPLQIPAVVIGVSFFRLYYLIGEMTGLYATGTLAGLVIGHTFMVTPYVVASTAAVLQRFNIRLEEAAYSLGASPWRVFRRVTLPVIMPGIFTGATYAFLVSFGDVPVSLFLGASGTAPFPSVIFQAMEYDFNPSILAVSTLVIFASVALIVVLQSAVGLDNLLKSNASK